jgi:hypothetical protein
MCARSRQALAVDASRTRNQTSNQPSFDIHGIRKRKLTLVDDWSAAVGEAIANQQAFSGHVMSNIVQVKRSSGQGWVKPATENVVCRQVSAILLRLFRASSDRVP